MTCHQLVQKVLDTSKAARGYDIATEFRFLPQLPAWNHLKQPLHVHKTCGKALNLNSDLAMSDNRTGAG